MSQVQQLLTEHLDIWTAAKTKKKLGRGHASGSAGKVYGIQKLRGLILDLALRGKLVPQDSNDKPASELLKRIQAEKAKLVAEGKLKKEKPSAPVADDEKSFELPIGWEWVRLSDLACSQAGFAFKSNAFNENGHGLPLIRIRDVGQEFSGTYYSGEFREEFVVKNGDYLVSMDGEFRVAKWESSDALLNQRVSRLIFYHAETAKEFVCQFLQIRLMELQGTKAYTTVDHLSGGQISNSVICFPPLLEQHRIVAKVDELMSLCGQLEQQHSNAAEVHEKLVSHLLGTLTQSQSVDDFSANWQRIASHFDTLFTTEASIDALKQTLLQLAVMGKLVPQYPNDEPASELLKRIQAEKAKLISEGKLKKEKPLAPIADDEKPFELPNGWLLVRLDDIGNTFIGLTYSPKDISNEGVPVLRSSNVQNGKIDLNDLVRVKKEIKGNLFVENGDLLICARNGSKALVGKTAMIKNLSEPMVFGAFMAIYKSQLNEYIEIFLNSPLFRKFLDGVETTTINQITQNNLKTTLLPLPPLKEQHRIVAKVDELMARCDQLKTRIQQANQQQQVIADVLVAQALD